MRWWDYAALLAAVTASVGLSGLMGAWAAERRLDQRQAKELARPSMRDSVAADEAEARDG